MNNSRKSLLTGFVAGALAASSLLVTATAASASAAQPGAGNAAGDGDPFVATTAHCRAEDVHAWAYPAGYLRGEKVVCDILSNESRIQGRITLQNVCPINGTAGCDATFRIDADSGASWEGAYGTVISDAHLGLQGAGRGGPAGAQIAFHIDNLDSAEGWDKAGSGDNVVGHIAPDK